MEILIFFTQYLIHTWLYGMIVPLFHVANIMFKVTWRIQYGLPFHFDCGETLSIKCGNFFVLLIFDFVVENQ